MHDYRKLIPGLLKFFLNKGYFHRDNIQFNFLIFLILLSFSFEKKRQIGSSVCRKSDFFL